MMERSRYTLGVLTVPSERSMAKGHTSDSRHKDQRKNTKLATFVGDKSRWGHGDDGDQRGKMRGGEKKLTICACLPIWKSCNYERQRPKLPKQCAGFCTMLSLLSLIKSVCVL